MRDAAIVAHTFGLDPVAVLRATALERLVRLAGHRIVQRELERSGKDSGQPMGPELAAKLDELEDRDRDDDE